jgi:hypothetical protein
MLCSQVCLKFVSLGSAAKIYEWPLGVCISACDTAALTPETCSARAETI